MQGKGGFAPGSIQLDQRSMLVQLINQRSNLFSKRDVWLLQSPSIEHSCNEKGAIR